MRLGKYYIGKFSLRSDAFTYALRIEVGDCFGNDALSPYQRMKAAFIAVYGYSPTLLPLKMRVRWLNDIAEEFKTWIEQEQASLDYKPSAEEIAAGVEDFSQKVGHLGTIKSIAQAYSRDPDDVLQWPWGKVFGILSTDLQEFEYNKRLQKQYDKHSRVS